MKFVNFILVPWDNIRNLRFFLLFFLGYFFLLTLLYGTNAKLKRITNFYLFRKVAQA